MKFKNKIKLLITILKIFNPEFIQEIYNKVARNFSCFVKYVLV